jgi:hypothetical protein
VKAVPLFLALFVPAVLHAQDEPPAGLAAVELARSRSCVATLNRMEELDRVLAPYAARMEHIRALGRAVSLEDIAEAGSLDPAQPLDAAVSGWFVQDSTLAARWVTERTDALQEERAQARTAMLEQVRLALQSVGGEAQAQLGDAAEVEAAALPCEGAILVRPVVVDACVGLTSALCAAASVAEPQEGFRFVDAPEDLWNVSDYRPWSQPGPLQATPQGALTGGRTSSRARRGNMVVSLGVVPLIRNRSELSPEEITDFEANLDSLGFTFDHPRFVLAPALEVQANVPAAIGGETHVLLHFGDLSGDDVIWSSEVGDGGVLQALFPASSVDLARLSAGEVVSLTAVRVPEAEGEAADPVYTVPLLTVSQAQYVSALIEYMANGDLGRDLAALVPPTSGAGSSGR